MAGARAAAAPEPWDLGNGLQRVSTPLPSRLDRSEHMLERTHVAEAAARVVLPRQLEADDEVRNRVADGRAVLDNRAVVCGKPGGVRTLDDRQGQARADGPAGPRCRALNHRFLQRRADSPAQAAFALRSASLCLERSPTTVIAGRGPDTSHPGVSCPHEQQMREPRFFSKCRSSSCPASAQLS